MDHFVDNNRFWGGIAVFETDKNGIALEPRKIKDFIPFGSWIMVKGIADEMPHRVKLISAEQAEVVTALDRIDSEYLVVLDPKEPDPNRNHPLINDPYKRICIFNVESITRAPEDVEVVDDFEEDELF